MFKVIITDRNGRASKIISKNEPEITDKIITLHPTPNYTLVFVIDNLTSYSITKLRNRNGEEKQEEQDHEEE